MISRKEEIYNFSLIIENLVKEKNLSYMDAMVHHCENTGLEIEIAAKTINKNIKTKIKMEAEDLNYLPKSKTRRLPI